MNRIENVLIVSRVCYSNFYPVTAKAYITVLDLYHYGWIRTHIFCLPSDRGDIFAMTHNKLILNVPTTEDEWLNWLEPVVWTPCSSILRGDSNEPARNRTRDVWSSQSRAKHATQWSIALPFNIALGYECFTIRYGRGTSSVRCFHIACRIAY